MRAQFEKTKKRVAALIALAAIPTAVYFVFETEWRGLWVDELVSAALSRKLGFPVLLMDVRAHHFSEFRFGLMTVGDAAHKTLVASGEGRVFFEPWAFLKNDGNKIHLRLSDVAVLESLYRKSSLLSWASRNAFNDPIFVKRIELFVVEGDGKLDGYVIEFDSEDLKLRGGFNSLNGTVLKANALVLLPEHKFERIPKELRGRMIERSGGWKGIRLVYSEQNLTIVGRYGPFFQARWS